MQPRGEFFDYDPLTGIHEYYEMDADGNIHIHSYQNVEPVMDFAKSLANSGLPDEGWKKNGWTMYAIIPAIVQGALLKKGINFMDPNDIGRVVHEMNTTYSAFKTTHKRHEVR